MIQVLEQMNQIVWGIPTLVLIIGAGIYLTVRTGGLQFYRFPKAIRIFCRSLRKTDTSSGGESSFRALCTALAATVGTGNIAGVAGAISIGGPGSIFWMWMCAFLGMVIKFSEAVLSVRYRTKSKHGEYLAGPMYVIQNGMGNSWRWLAVLYAFWGTIAAFGVGNGTQIHTVVVGINSVITTFGGRQTRIGNLIIGIAFAVLIGIILLGGAKRIGIFAEGMIPFASITYILLSLGVIILRSQNILGAFSQIINGAFSPEAVTGGMIGSSIQALRIGVSRGVFTNEAGMGTAGIAHGAANVTHPVEQGFMGIVEVFLDTIVICTMTALVILCSGVPILYGTDQSVGLTVQAFSSVYGSWVKVLLAITMCSFAIATILGWGLYGIRCAQFVFGEGCWRVFVWLQISVTVISALLSTKIVWILSELVNGVMAIPNLIAVVILSPELIRLLREYTSRTVGYRCYKRDVK